MATIERVAPARREADVGGVEHRRVERDALQRARMPIAGGLHDEQAERGGVHDGGEVVGPPLDRDVVTAGADALELEQDDVARAELRPVLGQEVRGGADGVGGVDRAGDLILRQSRHPRRDAPHVGVGADALDAERVVVAVKDPEDRGAVIALANAIHGIAARQPAAPEQILVGEPPLALDVDDLHAVTLAAAARPRIARVDAVRCGVEIALLGRQIRRARRRPRERCAPRLGAGVRRSIRRWLHVRARDVPVLQEPRPDLGETRLRRRHHEELVQLRHAPGRPPALRRLRRARRCDEERRQRSAETRHHGGDSRAIDTGPGGHDELAANLLSRRWRRRRRLLPRWSAFRRLLLRRRCPRRRAPWRPVPRRRRLRGGRRPPRRCRPAGRYRSARDLPSRPWPLRHSRRPPRARLTTLDPTPRVARDTSTTRSA